MFNYGDYVYVPGYYFGNDFSVKNNININNSVFVGKIIKTFNMSGHNWYNVFWFFFNENMWIDSKHLSKLPNNSNIIYGITYINNYNKKYFVIKNNKYIHNILDKEDKNKKNNNKNKENNKNKVDIINQFTLSNSTNIKYAFYA